MSQIVTPEARRAQAKALKEEGNDLAKAGRKVEALKKYEKGMRLLGLPLYELDEDGQEALAALNQDGRELLSLLASNAAQMYMDPDNKQLGKAIERCNVAVEANPANAKAYFRRATAALEHAGNVAKGTDSLLAQGQADVRKFLQLDPGNAAALSLQERLSRTRQAMLSPIMREAPRAEREAEPEWFQKVKRRAVFVCLCGTTATGRDQLNLGESLLSMALHAKDKNAISVGVAYVGYRAPDELEIFTEEWQKKFYRMLRLGERAVKVPAPRPVAVHGEVYNIWSLLDGRVRVMRVAEVRRSGERVGVAWMRYCAQLLWHGEPFVFQSCRAYLRFAPRWDEHLRNDLAIALRRQQKPVVSWMSQLQEDEDWQWVSDRVDYDDNNSAPPGALVGTHLDEQFGWPRWRRRLFSHTFGVPAQVAFFSPHNAFSTSEILTEVPADPFLNSIHFHGQITCENVRLHTQGFDVFAPCTNVTWETAHDARETQGSLQGLAVEASSREFFEEQKERVDALLDPWENRLTPLDDEVLDAPLPTGMFWTALFPKDSSPWDIGRQVGHRFMKGVSRTMTTFEQQTGVDLMRREVHERARNGGLNSDRSFEDSKVCLDGRERQLRREAAGGYPEY